jgi:TRAP-type C4-dicarboxylate transport system substrate-binding protein
MREGDPLRCGFVAWLWMLWLSGSAGAEPAHVRLRMAAIAPDGTAWARELKAAARDVALETHGGVEIKWYMGGIAGDESESIERIKRGQLDGAAGASFCERLAPSLRVLRMPGLVRDRDEGRYVISRLHRYYADEFASAGFVDLFVEAFGSETLFSRAPITSLQNLRASRVWVWGLAETLLRNLRWMGLDIVSIPLAEAGRGYEDNKFDAFVSVPTAMLAYQWISRVAYYTPLNLALLPGCSVVAQRAFDGISTESQKNLRAVIAKMALRFDDVGRAQDADLLGSLLEKKGIKRVPVSAAFQKEFIEAARKARSRETEVPRALIEQAEVWLAEFRAHGASSADR